MKFLRQWASSPEFWAVCLRLFFLALPLGVSHGDAYDFQAIADNLANGNGFSRCLTSPFPLTSDRPPLFPLLLGLVQWVGLRHVLGVPWLLNLIFDLLAIRAARRLGRATGMARPQYLLWLIALCPLLIFYGRYPLAESLGVWLFFESAALLFMQKGLRAGFFFGLLSLTRSYYLLLPFFLFIPRALPQMKGRFLAWVVLGSLLAPSVWIGRNFIQFGKPLFSQGGTAAFQSYVGFCRTNFSWWDQEDYNWISSHPVFSEMLGSHCFTQEKMMQIDQRGWVQVVDCIEAAPGSALKNAAVKTWNLFVDWGQVFPYDPVSWPMRMAIDGLFVLIWGFVLFTLLRDKKILQGSAVRYALLSTFYVLCTTAPFAIDARYLLGPALLMFSVAMSERAASSSRRRTR